MIRVSPSQPRITLVSEPLGSLAGNRLRNKIRDLLRNGVLEHVIDLRPLAELDSGSLAALIRVLRLARASGGSVSLIVDQENFLKLLSITGLEKVFQIFRDEAALEAAGETAGAVPA